MIAIDRRALRVFDYGTLAVLAALRRWDATGQGSAIRLPLDDVALATAANLGFLTEALVTGARRPRLGNAIYGQYGQDFTSVDGVEFMVVGDFVAVASGDLREPPPGFAVIG